MPSSKTAGVPIRLVVPSACPPHAPLRLAREIRDVAVGSESMTKKHTFLRCIFRATQIWVTSQRCCCFNIGVQSSCVVSSTSNFHKTLKQPPTLLLFLFELTPGQCSSCYGCTSIFEDGF